MTRKPDGFTLDGRPVFVLRDKDGKPVEPPSPLAARLKRCRAYDGEFPFACFDHCEAEANGHACPFANDDSP